MDVLQKNWRLKGEDRYAQPIPIDLCFRGHFRRHIWRFLRAWNQLRAGAAHHGEVLAADQAALMVPPAIGCFGTIVQAFLKTDQVGALTK